MRSVRAGLAVLLAASAVVVLGPPAAAVADPNDCTFKRGTAVPDVWPQRRLDFQQVWGITQGKGIKVAVIDSGVNFTNPQMRGISHEPGTSVIPRFDRTTRDCVGHGTWVTGIIAGQPLGTATFLGVAPQVTIVPIKQTNTEDDHSGSPDGIAAGIRYALHDHADVINISVGVPQPSTAMTAAVAAARAAGVVIVAAAGNDQPQEGQSDLEVYPAAYASSPAFDNVIAVSATDSKDAIANFSVAGRYVTVAAPGKDLPAPSTLGGYDNIAGTSFAAPYVTGTVALMLAADRIAHTPMTPRQVRDRLEETADAPPADVPNPQYGYGIVNPYLAVTSVQNDGDGLPGSTRAAPLPAPHLGRPAGRGLQHLALGLAFGLVGLTVLAVIGAAILRGGRRTRRVSAILPADERGTLVRR